MVLKNTTAFFHIFLVEGKNTILQNATITESGYIKTKKSGQCHRSIDEANKQGNGYLFINYADRNKGKKQLTNPNRKGKQGGALLTER